MKYLTCFLIIILCIHTARSQDFINNDLDGIVLGSSCLPNNWQNVPDFDVNCVANYSFSATPDLADLTGPAFSNGINGNPYSGSTFICGLYGYTGSIFYQEGIQQTVSGFHPGCNYSIVFHQAVVKQASSDALDTSGSWAVYFDNQLAGITTPTISKAVFNSNSLRWDKRSISFTSTLSTHTIKFLPIDDDNDQYFFGEGGALRMGIDSIYITQNFNNNNLSLSRDTTLCAGATLLLESTHSSGSYLWQDNSTGPSFLVTQPGVYWVRSTTSCGIYNDTVKVSYNTTTIDLDLGNDTTICSNDILSLDAYNTNATYLWQDNSTNAAFQVTSAGVYHVKVNLNGCIDNDTIRVYSNPIPSLDFGNDRSLCEGETLILGHSITNATYLWQDNSANPTFTVSDEGKYYVRVTVDDCSNSDTINVNYDPLFTINLGNDTTLCEGETLTLDPAVSNASYRWQNNSTSSFFKVVDHGTYWVNVSIGACSAADTIQLNYISLPDIDLGKDRTLCLGDTLILDATTSNATFLWQNSSTQPKFQLVESGIYWVEVSTNNCIIVDSIQVNYEDCEFELTIPSLFTPNNDSINDTFTPIKIKGVVAMHTEIVNRWGDLIYSTDKHLIEWDGRSVSDGIYFWVIEYYNKKGEKFNKKGWVQILR